MQNTIAKNTNVVHTRAVSATIVLQLDSGHSIEWTSFIEKDKGMINPQKIGERG
jgi:hypothetical protein